MMNEWRDQLFNQITFKTKPKSLEASPTARQENFWQQYEKSQRNGLKLSTTKAIIVQNCLKIEQHSL